MATLPEDLLLLSLHPRTGRLRGGLSWDPRAACAAAILEELRLEGLVRLDRRVVVAAPAAVGRRTPPAGSVLGDCLAAIQAEPGRRLGWWLGRLGRRVPGLRDRIVAELAASGRVNVRESRRLGFRVRRIHAVGGARVGVTGDVRRDVCAPTLGERDRARLALLHACGAAKPVLPPEGRRAARKRLRALVRENPVARALQDRMEAWAYVVAILPT